MERLPRHSRRSFGRRRDGRGAAAVEFALVSVLLFPLLFGIIDYGLWFNDSLNARQGVREAARLGVVQNVSCGTGTTFTAQLTCATKREVGAVAGTTYVKVGAPQGWDKTRQLVVCTMVKVDGITGIVPLPKSAVIRASTQMSIEVAAPVPPGMTTTGATWAAESLPAGFGDDWSWCV